MALTDSFFVTGGETQRAPNNADPNQRKITIRIPPTPSPSPIPITAFDQWSGQKV